MESDGDLDAESTAVGEASTEEERIEEEQEEGEDESPMVGPAQPVVDPPVRDVLPAVNDRRQEPIGVRPLPVQDAPIAYPSVPRHPVPAEDADEPGHISSPQDQGAESSRSALKKKEDVPLKTDVPESGKGSSTKQDSYFGPTADYLGSQKEEKAVVVVPPPRYNKV